MHRPTRQFKHLIEKVAAKDAIAEAINHKKPGRRTKRWRKWVEAYRPLSTDTAQG